LSNPFLSFFIFFIFLLVEIYFPRKIAPYILIVRQKKIEADWSVEPQQICRENGHSFCISPS
jgi:hypothetical protein